MSFVYINYFQFLLLDLHFQKRKLALKWEVRKAPFRCEIALGQCWSSVRSSYHRSMFPEWLIFRPAGSALSNHLIPYLFVLFRSGLWSRPFVFCCQDGSLLSAAELAGSEIKGRIDGKSSPSRGPLLFSVALTGTWWDTLMATQRLWWQPCECSLQYLFVSFHVLLCQWLPQCHALALAQSHCILLW